MQIVIGTLTALLSTTVLAATCPNYNGTFLCKNESMEQVMNLKTEVVDGQYHYTLDNSTLIADGVVRPIEYQGGLFDMAATCSEEKVSVKIVLPGGEGDNEECGAEKWDLHYTLNFNPKGENFIESHASQTVCASGKAVPNSDDATMDCTRQP